MCFFVDTVLFFSCDGAIIGLATFLSQEWAKGRRSRKEVGMDGVVTGKV